MNLQESISILVEKAGIDPNTEKILGSFQYFKVDVANGSEIVKILDTSTQKKIGESSFHNGELPKGEYFLATHARIASHDGAGLNAKVFTSLIDDPALANSEITFWQDGKEIGRIYIEEFRTEVVPTTGVGESFAQLTAPIFIMGGLPVEARLEVAKGTSIGTPVNLLVAFKGPQNKTR